MIPVTFKCAHCRDSNSSANKIKAHLFQRHSGCILYALDMKAAKLRQKRYLFFCLKTKCKFETKDGNEFLKHCEECTPWAEGEKNVDSSLVRSLEMTKQFIVKTQISNRGSSKEFHLDRFTAEYGCDYCSYISNNNTRLKKHVLSIHGANKCVIRDLQSEKNKRSPAVYFCSHCLWETRELLQLEEHLEDNHGSRDVRVPASSIEAVRPDSAPSTQVSFPSTSTRSAETTKSAVAKTKLSLITDRSKHETDDNGWEDEEVDLLEIYESLVPKTDLAKAMKDFEDFVGYELNGKKESRRPSRTAVYKTQMRYCLSKSAKPHPLYRCLHCNYISFGTLLIRQHIKEKHKNQALCATDIYKAAKSMPQESNTFFCPNLECSYSGTLDDIELHAKTVHDLNTDDPDLRLMAKHTENKSKATPAESYECLYCDTSQIFATRSQMKSHLLEHHSKEPLIFRDCIARKQKQPSRFYLCAESLCEYTSVREKNCLLHAMAHQKATVLECSKCQWFTKSDALMKKHHADIHKDVKTLTLLVDLDLDSQGQLVKLVNGTAIKTEH